MRKASLNKKGISTKHKKRQKKTKELRKPKMGKENNSFHWGMFPGEGDEEILMGSWDILAKGERTWIRATNEGWHSNRRNRVTKCSGEQQWKPLSRRSQTKMLRL